MSTYLVALAVGDIACEETLAGTVPLAVCSTPSRRHLSSFAMEAAVATLDYFNDYFAID